MSEPRVKICGITRGVDGRLAVLLGASYLGFILYPKSPRAISLDKFTSIKESLPDSFRVVVDVSPSVERLRDQMLAGFDYFQVHFSDIHNAEYLSDISQLVGRDRLWLAPKLVPGTLFPESLFEYTNTFLIDTYHVDSYGGSGKTGDWVGFDRLQSDYPEKTWILAGGLNSGNLLNALNSAHPRFIDASSGVESSPGIKDEDKLRAFFGKLNP